MCSCFSRYSILPALSLDGILHLEVLDHAFTGKEFKDFVTGVLNWMQPWPLSNSVLVIDNAAIHKVPGIREMVEAWYVIISFKLRSPDVYFYAVECNYCISYPTHLI